MVLLGSRCSVCWLETIEAIMRFEGWGCGQCGSPRRGKCEAISNWVYRGSIAFVRQQPTPILGEHSSSGRAFKQRRLVPANCAKLVLPAAADVFANQLL